MEGLLLRLDLSAVGALNHQQTSFTGEDAESYSFDSNSLAIGPKLALNLGIAPAKLVRIGVFGSVEGMPNITSNGSLPHTQVDGQFRWAVGPSLGFRFGPSVPLELELALALAQMHQVGSQNDIGAPDNRYPLSGGQWGGQGGAKLLYRPGGAGDTFALHLGLLGGLTGTGANGTDTKASLMALELGISIGL